MKCFKDKIKEKFIWIFKFFNMECMCLIICMLIVSLLCLYYMIKCCYLVSRKGDWMVEFYFVYVIVYILLGFWLLNIFRCYNFIFIVNL